MAINFEAANMAGYNNPKIEVFKGTSKENGEIITAPTKSTILGCLKRGCIPFILLTTDISGVSQHVLWTFSAAREMAENSQLSFTATYGGTVTTLAYSSGDDSLPSLM